jgi:hypothetical protein
MVVISLALAVALSGSPKASQKTQLTIDIKPETAVVYVDGKKKGTGKKPITLTVKPGRHQLRIVNNKDEHSETVVVKKGESKKWEWAFEDDRRDVRAPRPEAEETETSTGGSGAEGADATDDLIESPTDAP